MGNLFAAPRSWLASTGDMTKFCGRVLRDVYGARVLRFFGEALRQAGVLILSSTLVIWGLVFIIWMFQNPPDLLYSVIKGMVMATAIVLVGCYYGYNAGGGPVGVGTATAKSMVVNIVLVHLIGMLGTQVFWGANPRAPIGG